MNSKLNYNKLRGERKGAGREKSLMKPQLNQVFSYLLFFVVL
jgi:hypothetical protein